MATKNRPGGPPPDLRTAIKDAGFDWYAGDTPMTALSESERQAHLGLQIDKKEMAATAAAIAAVQALETSAFGVGAPAAIDWRSNGGNWVTSIKDQLSCGSCVSFACCATIESRVRIACRDAAFAIDLSEADLFYCGCGKCCDPGWNFPPALNYAKATGIANETKFPYTPGDQPCKTGIGPYLKIKNWTALLSMADRKNAIATKGPVVAGFIVYEDFYSYQSGVYRHVSGVEKGGHAISVVGYDDAQKCWICKNSWGPSFGESGYFRMGYGEAGMDTSFAFYDIDVDCPDVLPPVDDCASFVPQLRRVLELARQNPNLRQCLRYHVCGRPPRPRLCPPNYMQIVDLVKRILQRCPQYRVSFCRALG
jgi:C1A family cysteine protease